MSDATPTNPAPPTAPSADTLAKEQADFAAAQAGGTVKWSETLWARIGIPTTVGFVVLMFWEWAVDYYQVRSFVLPAPSVIGSAMFGNIASLMGSWWVTFSVTVQAFVLALVGGVALAILFTQSRLIELALFPYAVVLQVTPVVSIAPLIIIWVGFDNLHLALLIMAWLVAFFPILSNTVMGLRSVDHNLINLFKLYGASRWQILLELQMPAALPYILAGMKISGGLALIGAVVAEFVGGASGAAGLAWRIIESGNRLQIDRMFAALVMMSFTGIAIFFFLHFLQYFLLRKWHESALRSES